MMLFDVEVREEGVPGWSTDVVTGSRRRALERWEELRLRVYVRIVEWPAGRIIDGTTGR